MSVTALLLLFLPAAFLTITIGASVNCPSRSDGFILRCAFKCCPSFEGKDQGYYCCGDESSLVKNVMEEEGNGRAQRFVAYGTQFQVDYTLLLIGLIVSVVLSVICSLLCCLLCNGCWLHKRRNPQMYESVNDSPGGFGIPMGTVVFSTHPPQFREESMYHSTGSLPSSRNRVRFNEDGTPRGVLKNGKEEYR